MKKSIENLPVLGYSCEKLYVFIRRGDFGGNKKVQYIQLDARSSCCVEFYEFCIMLEKTGNVSQTDICFASEFSKTAIDRAKSDNAAKILDFFDNLGSIANSMGNRVARRQNRIDLVA